MDFSPDLKYRHCLGGILTVRTYLLLDDKFHLSNFREAVSYRTAHTVAEIRFNKVTVVLILVGWRLSI